MVTRIKKRRSRPFRAEHYQKIGRRGGKATAATHDHNFYRKIGHKGGRAVSSEYGPDYFREIGHRGGVATAASRSRSHPHKMSRKRLPSRKTKQPYFTDVDLEF